MDYYEGVVLHYLRADRAIFVNSECCVQVNAAENPDMSGPHWYCDAAAVDFRQQTVFLCEISYSVGLSTLAKRLMAWQAHWDDIRVALVRDSFLPQGWPVRPWLFVPEALIPLLLRRLEQAGAGAPPRFTPRITPLEMTQPWRFRSWNRVGEAAKPDSIPPSMQK